MKEARMILPWDDLGDRGAAVYHTTNKLCATFGGVTETRGNGLWRDSEGKPIAEQVAILDIAYEPTDENDAKLYDIAWQYGEEAKQTSVYLRYGNGFVQLVSKLSCMDNGHGHFDLSFGGVIEAMNDLTDTGKSREDRMAAFEYLESALVSREKAA